MLNPGRKTHFLLFLPLLFPAFSQASLEPTGLEGIPGYNEPGYMRFLLTPGEGQLALPAEALLLAAKDDQGSHGRGKLSPEERQKLKKYRERFESLPPEERQRLREAREKYKKMSPEERQSLRKKWENMTEEEKRQYKINRNRD